MKWKHAVIILIFPIFIFGFWVAATQATNVTTQATATSATIILTQKDYRWYDNIDALTPTAALASLDAAIITPGTGTELRLRMNVQDTSLQLNAGATFKLQYANSTSGPWTNISTSTAWVFFDNPSVADGQIISGAVLGSDVGESYGESNPSAATPNAILPNQTGEWDWVLANNSASAESNWFFRMVYASGTLLDNYSNYPALAAAPPSPPPAPPPPPSGGGSIGVGGGTGFPVPPPKPPGSATSLPISPPLIPSKFQAVDLNGDNRVDIVDLSILLYYYNQQGPGIAKYDLDGDQVIDLRDVSILMYYWTE